MKESFVEGDLVQVIACDGRTLHEALPISGGKHFRKFSYLREKPSKKNKTFDHLSLEGKLGLIVSVVRNKLNQPVRYVLRVAKKDFNCPALNADKYLIKMKNSSDTL